MCWTNVHGFEKKTRSFTRYARQTRALLELTDQAVREHFEGKSTVGLYPLLPAWISFHFTADITVGEDSVPTVRLRNVVA